MDKRNIISRVKECIGVHHRHELMDSHLPDGSSIFYNLWRPWLKFYRWVIFNRLNSNIKIGKELKSGKIRSVAPGGRIRKGYREVYSAMVNDYKENYNE
jgi:hypothetical protein